jgi:hypothetical protein
MYVFDPRLSLTQVLEQFLSLKDFEELSKSDLKF